MNSDVVEPYSQHQGHVNKCKSSFKSEHFLFKDWGDHIVSFSLIKPKLGVQTCGLFHSVPVEQGQSSLMQRNLAPRVYFVILVMAMTSPSKNTYLMGLCTQG